MNALLYIAIVPEKSFFENFLLNYKKNDNFISAKKEVEGYQNILARNFSRQVSEIKISKIRHLRF